jgi:hypothetical protein
MTFSPRTLIDLKNRLSIFGLKDNQTYFAKEAGTRFEQILVGVIFVGVGLAGALLFGNAIVTQLFSHNQDRLNVGLPVETTGSPADISWRPFFSLMSIPLALAFVSLGIGLAVRPIPTLVRVFRRERFTEPFLSKPTLPRLIRVLGVLFVISGLFMLVAEVLRITRDGL